MEVNENFGRIADQKTLLKVINALEKNRITAFLVETGEDANNKLLELIPEGAEVMNMTSMTHLVISTAKEITESGRFKSIRNQLDRMDMKTEWPEMRRLGAVQEWAIGSVHAVTEEGQLMIASRSGSQLPAYAYGAAHVIWVIGAQKVVKNLDEGFKRIYEYSLPLEDERARKAYGRGSGVNKILIINQELTPGRLYAILVKEKLGF
ncbi:MAG TPA: LUD domain-containing protein [Terriglobales bacterium]|nr:LUD domain-containing protein [Terriglobales bacterium]